VSAHKLLHGTTVHHDELDARCGGGRGERLSTDDKLGYDV